MVLIIINLSLIKSILLIITTIHNQNHKDNIFHDILVPYWIIIHQIHSSNWIIQFAVKLQTIPFQSNSLMFSIIVVPQASLVVSWNIPFWPNVCITIHHQFIIANNDNKCTKFPVINIWISNSLQLKHKSLITLQLHISFMYN